MTRTSAPPIAVHDVACVFLHGILGFSHRRLLFWDLYYFRGVREHLSDLGAPVYFPTAPACGTIAERAQAIAQFLRTVPERRLLLVGHSMGGLDARYLIHHLDPERRVKVLVTMGTPHRGTPLVSELLSGKGPVARAARWLAMPGLADLSPQACDRFNQQTPNRADVDYYAFAGARPVHELPLPFRPWARLIAAHAGDNDGQVPVSSAMWGERAEVIASEHLEMVGLYTGCPGVRRGSRFPHLSFYRSLLERLLPALANPTQ